MSGWRQRLLGDEDRLGWWLLPLFLMVGLGGAVIAGSLAVVYYAQQVSQLEQETRGAREDLVGAVDEVRDAADEALSAISEEVADVQERLARGLPLEDALEIGVVRLEVDVEVPDDRPAEPRSGQQTNPAPDDGDDDGDGDGDDGDATDEQGDGASAPAPSRPPIPVRRAASGFVVVSDGSSVFIATTLQLLDDPRRDETVPIDTGVTVRIPGGTTTATVHSWDADADLLLLSASVTNVEPLPWRPEDQPLGPGDRVIAVGATPGLAPVRVAGDVGSADDVAIVTDLPDLELVSGGPVVDIEGRVVGVSSQGYRPFGQDPLVVPVRRLCDRMLSSCPD
jgi:S1-C subfamily serine protease